MTESVTDKVVDTITDNELTETMLSAGNWVADNQELLLQYAVNLISAVLILFIGNIIVKTIANGVAKMLRKNTPQKILSNQCQALQQSGKKRDFRDLD